VQEILAGPPTKKAKKRLSLRSHPAAIPSSAETQAKGIPYSNQKGLRAPADEALARALTPVPKCTVCLSPKTSAQTWEQHNLGAKHIGNLCKRRADKIPVYCELCFTRYPNALHYRLHTTSEEHHRRRKDLERVIRVAVSVKSIKPWPVEEPLKLTIEHIKGI